MLEFYFIIFVLVLGVLTFELEDQLDQEPGALVPPEDHRQPYYQPAKMSRRLLRLEERINRAEESIAALVRLEGHFHESTVKLHRVLGQEDQSGEGSEPSELNEQQDHLSQTSKVTNPLRRLQARVNRLETSVVSMVRLMLHFHHVSVNFQRYESNFGRSDSADQESFSILSEEESHEQTNLIAKVIKALRRLEERVRRVEETLHSIGQFIGRLHEATVKNKKTANVLGQAGETYLGPATPMSKEQLEQPYQITKESIQMRRLRSRLDRLEMSVESLVGIVADFHGVKTKQQNNDPIYGRAGKRPKRRRGKFGPTPEIFGTQFLSTPQSNPHEIPRRPVVDQFYVPTNNRQLEAMCGVTAATGRVFNGNKVRRGEFPWMAQLKVPTLAGVPLDCGGTIISRHLILTAAHCVVDDIIDTDEYIKITLGEVEYDKSAKYVVEFSDIVIHPHYMSTDTIEKSDIALLVVREEINFSEFVRPICLPLSGHNYTNTETLVAGWGNYDKRLVSSWTLRKGTVILNNKDCLPTQFCSTAKSDETHVCGGDSGGPLMVAEDGRFFIIGVASHTVSDYPKAKCDENPVTEVFTRVSEYLKWILWVVRSRYLL